MFHRKKEKINHPFIHLNLCIALALGLVVFLAGIETGTEYRVSNMHTMFFLKLIIVYSNGFHVAAVFQCISALSHQVKCTFFAL